MARLAGKRALVTGGNSGIGLATARLFAAEGALVAIAGRDEATLAVAAESLGEEAVAVRADVTSPEDRGRLMETVQRRLGSLDILFANAGIVGQTPLGSTDQAAFERVLQINVTGVFFTVQDALPLLADGASVILNSSVLAVMGRPGNAAYAGSKAAVRAMGRVFASELSGRGIRVNVVSPGVTETPIWTKGRTPEDVAALRTRTSLTIPLSRWARADEVAGAVLFLASDEASFVQGAELLVDGGSSGHPLGWPLLRG